MEYMENNEKIISLAKPAKNGFLKFVFSRFFLFIVLLVLEVILFVGLYFWF